MLSYFADAPLRRMFFGLFDTHFKVMLLLHSVRVCDTHSSRLLLSWTEAENK